MGEIVTRKVDLAMFHDSSGPRRLKPMLDDLGHEMERVQAGGLLALLKQHNRISALGV